ncbi:hypothetical protein V501_09855 [Pseudogymnoascus sp. VKM F-4519 (FW-2642)]|nr:hypothetical protein V501_09855 [Pseudogymnoascus sp. VKM F-4519 (FW-2642)]
MEDSPPPYPGPYPGPNAQAHIQHLDSVPFSDPDLETFSHPHVLLISVIKSVDGLGATVIHYWTARSPTTSITIYSKLGIDSFQHVRDFRELGTFTLPTGIEPSNVHECLTSLITESPTISSDPEIIPHIVAQLSSLPQNDGLSVQLFSIPVFGNSAEELLIGGPIPLWKWAKPTSIYGRKTGFWEVELGKAIEDGEWMAGKELQILVKGVPDGSAEDLKKHRMKFGILKPTGKISNDSGGN